MGMFGGGLSNALQIIGASLKDADPEGQGGNLATVQKMMLSRQQDAQKQAFIARLGGMIGGQAAQYQNGPDVNVQAPQMPRAQSMEDPSSAISQALSRLSPQAAQTPAPAFTYQPPTRTADAVPGLNINSPELPLIALQAQQAGVNLDDVLKVMTAQQPDVHYDRGFGYNGKTGEEMGAFHPDLDKGQTYQDGVVSNLPGAVSAAADMAGGVTGAQERAKAGLDVMNMNMPDGSTQQIPRDVAVQSILRSLMPGGSGGGLAGIGRSQTPAAASAAKITADAQATAQTTLPADLNGVDTAIETATSLRNHPALGMRTGGWSMLPAIAGTPGAEFESYKEQVLGQGFMNARQALKGAGQITDFEGAKAEKAIIRAKAAQSPQAFQHAMDDYVSSLQRARTIMQQRAGQSPQGQSAGAAAPARATGPAMSGKGYKIISVE